MNWALHFKNRKNEFGYSNEEEFKEKARHETTKAINEDLKKSKIVHSGEHQCGEALGIEVDVMYKLLKLNHK